MKQFLLIICFLFLFNSCIPVLPPPPIFPENQWFFFCIIIFLGFYLWKKFSKDKNMNKDYLTDTLNSINERLLELEQKLDKLEKKIK